MGFIKNKEEQDILHKERKNERNLAGLLEQLKDKDPETRCWAARDLASYPESVTSLASVLAEETHLNVREAILTSLTLIGG
ncbi:MAG: HEAT repeat domain-containing protein, partial [Spirochaetes bacterium]